MEKTETMKHTKEPWVVEKTLQGRDSSISNRRGKTIAIAYQNENIDGDDLANAKRIVACVNACKGLTNEVLDKGILDDAIALVLNAGKDIGITWDGMAPYYEGVKVWED